MLSKALMVATKVNVPDGIRFHCACPQVTHPFFADNYVIFLETSTKNCMALLKTIHEFGEASGQSVNFGKSSIFFCKKLNPRVVESIKNILCISELYLNLNYPGLPIFGREKIYNFFLLKSHPRS